MLNFWRAPEGQRVRPMKKPTKPTAADRTVDMFTGQTRVDAATSPEFVQEEVTVRDAAERQTMEESADASRDMVAKYLDWATSAFGKTEARSDQFRLSKVRNQYVLERLAKRPGDKEAYGYAGYVINDCDLYDVAKLFVAAVREKQGRER